MDGAQLARLFVMAAFVTDYDCFVSIEGTVGELVLERFQEPADRIRCEADVSQAQQRRKLLGAGLQPAARHVRLLVPFEEGRGPAEVGDLGQDVLQLLQMVVRGAYPCGYSPEWACRPACRPASSVDRASVFYTEGLR